MISQLVESILEDRRSIQPVSVRLDDDYGMSDVCLSVPARIGADGIQRLVHLRLEAAEQTALQHSAGVLRNSLSSVVM